jgi:phenylalanyl-tRNA synthetase alpha chain
MRVEEISTWVEDARKAFASATDLDSLKAARLAHAGDKSPIALASRALGSLSPEDKACFWKGYW